MHGHSPRLKLRYVYVDGTTMPRCIKQESKIITVSQSYLNNAKNVVGLDLHSIFSYDLRRNYNFVFL